jgi:ABC-type lipoprotein release transport system permease subunit
MTFGRLLLRNLFYHWRGNLAVLLGVAVGTAVLTGALLVGDSLRGSLRDRVLQQLGWVEDSLVAGRFFREELAADPGKLGVTRASPVLLLQGAASTAPALGQGEDKPGSAVHRVPRITVLGVTDSFWPEGEVPVDAKFWQGGDEEVVLNEALARELGVGAGGTIALSLQKASAVPRESLLGRRGAGDVLDTWRVSVRAVIGDGLSQFSLTPSPATVPRNAFVPLHALQTHLDLPGRVNALLTAGANPPAGGKVEDWLQDHLHAQLTLDDWGLVLHDPESRTRDLFARLDRNHDGRLTRGEWQRRVANHFARTADQDHDGVLTYDEVLAFFRKEHAYLSLESRQMILDPAVAAAADAAAGDTHLTSARTLVYLANTISDRQASIPYSVVAALDPGLPPPLGPFLPESTLIAREMPVPKPPAPRPVPPEDVKRLRDDQIVLADWKDSPLHVKPGDRITVTYFEPEEEGRLREKTAAFTLAGFVPLEGAAADPDLAPEFPGITDKLDIRDWDPPFPYHNELIQPRDEHYWDEYRTTPKAYVTLAAGQKLWHTRFGSLTSIRLTPAAEGASPSADLASTAEDYRRSLLQHLRPEQGGLVYDPVRRRGLEASSGFFDFGILFLCFSCFLIAAALLLVGLLFRLNLDRRAAEVGVLLATGYRRWTVRWLLLGEGAVLAAVGGFAGLALAVGYAWVLLGFLRSWWRGSLDQSFLSLHAGADAWPSYVIGYAAALVVSLLTVAWAVRVLGRVAPRALLSGETTAEGPRPGGRVRWSPWVAGVSALLALACAVSGNWVSDPEMKAMTFFSSGALLLTAGLAAVWAWMRGTRRTTVGGHGGLALARLGVRNAARHPVRSLLTAGLLAAAAFLIVAVESFHRDPGADFFIKEGGSGGFTLIAETDVPVYENLSTPEGRDKLDFPDADSAALNEVPDFPFRLRAGEDASCVNLYQPRRPRLLGVPHAFVERGGFHFRETASDPQGSGNPWRLLEQPPGDNVVPVFGEANTVDWMLKSGLGQDVQVPDESGNPVTLRFVGILKDSVFQGELLMSEENFLRLYPRQEGYQFFLVGAPPDRARAVRDALERGLAGEGVAVQTTEQRVAAALAVENTYLATFQALGGLGLLLGALGLAVVLLRSVWERRGELALLRALGYRRLALGWLVLAENGFLLLLGLAVGTLTALLAVAPPLLAGGGGVPWLRLLGLLGLVLVVGLAAAAVAVASTLRAPLLPALRRE